MEGYVLLWAVVDSVVGFCYVCELVDNCKLYCEVYRSMFLSLMKATFDKVDAYLFHFLFFSNIICNRMDSSYRS